MSIRYRRVGLKIERVPTPPLVQTLADLTDLAHQAQDVRELAQDVRVRIHRLKAGLLADHARRVVLDPVRTLAQAAKDLGITGEDVRRARQRVGLGQRALAAHLGIHRSCVAEAERGCRTPTERLALWAQGVLRATGEEQEVDG